jgi:hypothetical protein
MLKYLSIVLTIVSINVSDELIVKKIPNINLTTINKYFYLLNIFLAINNYFNFTLFLLTFSCILIINYIFLDILTFTSIYS